MKTDTNTKPTDICVDGDGTLLQCDTALENFSTALKKNPSIIIYFLFWLLRGKAFVKDKLAKIVQLDVTTLPYNDFLIEFLREKKQLGHKIHLYTGMNEINARSISDYLGIFDSCNCSNLTCNLTGTKKRDKLISDFGTGNYYYAGNSVADIPSWQHCKGAILVNVPSSVEIFLKRNKIDVIHKIGRRNRLLVLFFRAMRVPHWVKNLVLFLPLFASLQIFDLAMVARTLMATISFSLLASSCYIYNDILDLQKDRIHPLKRSRPIASGLLDFRDVLSLSSLLFATGIILGSLISLEFVGIAIAYFATTLSYSMKLKDVPFLDIALLTSFYIFRIIAGAIAIEVDVSMWLIGFSFFFFVNIAIFKRAAEHKIMIGRSTTSSITRPYSEKQLIAMKPWGQISSCGSVMVLFLYLIYGLNHEPYSNSSILYLSIPLLIFWQSYYWMYKINHIQDDDPISFLLKDKVSLCIYSLTILIFLISVINFN